MAKAISMAHFLKYYLLLKTEPLDNTIQELWLAQPSWYISHHTMLSKYGSCTRLLKIQNQLKIGCFYNITSRTVLATKKILFI